MKPVTAGNTPEPHNGLFTRKVSVERALEAARRLINSHFNKPDKARCSIPANADDDDIVLTDYLRQSRVAAPSQEAAPPKSAEALAQQFHETYERLAPLVGYATRRESAKPWAEVPETNRILMIAVCREILGSMCLGSMFAEPAPSPATKDTPPRASAGKWIETHESMSGWSVGRFLQKIAEHGLTDELACCLEAFYAANRSSQGPAREETIIDLAKKMSAAGYCNIGACKEYLQSAYDAGAQSRTPTKLESRTAIQSGTLQTEIVSKLTRRAAFLRKSFGNHPASLACLAEELERQAKEISELPDLESRTVAPQPELLEALRRKCKEIDALAQTYSLSPSRDDDHAFALNQQRLGAMQMLRVAESLAGAAALPSTPNDDVLNRLIEGQRLEFVRLRSMFSEDSLSLLANRIQSELGDGGLVQEHRDIMRILVDYFKGAQPCEAPATSVPAASSPTKEETLRRELDEVKTKLQKFVTVTNYARCAEDSGPGDLQTYIEGLWAKRKQWAELPSPPVASQPAKEED